MRNVLGGSLLTTVERGMSFLSFCFDEGIGSSGFSDWDFDFLLLVVINKITIMHTKHNKTPPWKKKKNEIEIKFQKQK